MRYAVLSDIHGNLEALTAVLDSLTSAQIDRVLCPGDVVGYGADPVACLDRLRARETVIVAGNHDLACVGKMDVGWFNQAARAAVRWTRDQLSVTDLDLLRRLHVTEIVEPCTLVHGTLKHPQRFEYLVDAGQAIDTLASCKTLMCLIGHTHLPGVVEYNRSQRRLTRILTKPDELAEIALLCAMQYPVTVVGVADEKWGERPVLVIQPRESAEVSDEDLLAALRGRVAPWWIPDAVIRVDQMALASTGKIDKMRLRVDYGDC